MFKTVRRYTRPAGGGGGDVPLLLFSRCLGEKGSAWCPTPAPAASTPAAASAPKLYQQSCSNNWGADLMKFTGLVNSGPVTSRVTWTCKFTQLICYNKSFLLMRKSAETNWIWPAPEAGKIQVRKGLLIGTLLCQQTQEKGGMEGRVSKKVRGRERKKEIKNEKERM